MFYCQRPVAYCCLRFVLPVVFSLMISCSGDPEGDPQPQPGPGPTPGISNAEIDLAEKDQKYFIKNAALTITANDAEGISKIEAFIGDLKIGEKSFSDNQVTYPLSWNTTNVQDNEHTLKIIVSDKTGSKSEKQFKLRVRNILMTITGSPMQITASPKSEGWVYLSDDTGATLVIKQFMSQDGVVKLESPAGFMDDIFNMTFVQDIILGGTPTSKRTEFTTYVKVRAGGSHNFTTNAVSQPVVGEATVNISGVPSGMVLSFSSPTANWSTSYANGSPLSVKIKLRKDVNDVFISSGIQNISQKYKMVSGLKSGDVVDLQYETFTDFQNNDITLHNAIEHHVDLYGFRRGESGNFLISYDDNYLSAPNDVKVKYTSEQYFDYVGLLMTFNEDGVLHRNFLWQDNPPTDVVRLNSAVGALSYDGINMNASLTGEGDVARVSFWGYTRTASMTHTVGHMFYVPVEEVQLTVPKIPGNIKALYLPDGFPAIEYKDVEFSSASYLDSYDQIANDNYTIPQKYEFVVKAISNYDPEGRKKSKHLEYVPLYIDPALRIPTGNK